MFRYDIGNVNLEKFDCEVRNTVSGLSVYLESENDNVTIVFKDIKQHKTNPEEGEPLITYTRHFERDDFDEEGNPIKVPDSEDYTARMVDILAKINSCVAAHDPTPIEPPKTDIEILQEENETLKADMATIVAIMIKKEGYA